MDPEFDTFERVLQPSFIDMPKVNRDDVVETFWDNVSILRNRKEIFFIQASPGCGKTYALREIGRVSRTKEKSHYLCVGVSFNSETGLTKDELVFVGQNPLNAGAILSIPRIIYSLFVKDISYDAFSAALFEAFDVTYLISFMTTQVISLLKARRPQGFEIILLVDEISKIKSPDFIESARSYLCKLIVQPNYAYCVFSSLYFNIIVDTQTFETATGRKVFPLGPLHMFNLIDRISLFHRYFEKYRFKVVDRHGVRYSEEKYKKVLNLLIHNMAIYTAGHPRSLDAIISTLFRLLYNNKLKPIRLNSVMLEACIMINGSLKPDFIAVCESLIARTVNYHDIIPFSNPEITYDKAVAVGQLIGSNKKIENYVPFLTPMAYYNFITNHLSSENSFYSLMAKHLNNILNVQSFFTYEGFEHIAYTREALMSITRNYSQNSPETFRQLLRGLGLYSSNSDLFDVSLLSSTCFDITKFISATKYLSSSQSNIYVPENKRNKGYDFFIRFPTNDNRFLNIVFEMKYSDPFSTSPANLNKAMIDNKHNICKKLFGNSFIFVVFGWREINSKLKSSDLPSNTVVFDKNVLSQLYGPSFADFINIQMTDEPQVILDADIGQVEDVNNKNNSSVLF